MDILPYDQHNQVNFLKKISTKSQAVYIITLIMIIGGICLLPFISVEIAVNAAGIIRPINEKAIIRSPVSGIIDSIFVQEGDRVVKHQLLFKLKDSTLYQNQARLKNRISELNEKIYDLSLLLRKTRPEISEIRLKTSFYRHDLISFQSQVSREKFRLIKLDRDLTLAEQLSRQNIIAHQELFEKQNAFDIHHADVQNLVDAQKARWAEELNNYVEAVSALQAESSLIREQHHQLLVYSPLTGVVQNFHGKYSGDFVPAGETVCFVTPDTGLVVETFINSAEIGLLARDQPCVIRADAFNHTYFGFLTGSILTIDQDYTLIDGRPCFKIKTRLHTNTLAPKGNFVPELKKGMSVQMRFLVAERTLWQLLYDSIDDWLPKNDFK